MKIFAVISCALALITFGAVKLNAQNNLCKTGLVKGFAFVKGDPRIGGTGAIPNQFTSDPNYLGVRFNCSKKGVQVKRVDTGIYDILFPDNPSVAVAITGGEGLVTGVTRFDRGYFRVSIRSPLVDNGILQPRESSFYIVLF